jgi:hypothetical protein
MLGSGSEPAYVPATNTALVVVARIKADIRAGGRYSAASIIRIRHRRCAAVAASRHRRRYGDRDGKRQREHQADHDGSTISSEFDAE